jgi:uncharacterized iron-regulated protein
VFLNLLGAAKGALIRAATSTPTFGAIGVGSQQAKKMKTIIHIILAILLLASAQLATPITAGQNALPGKEPVRLNVTKSIVELFDKYQVVALSEAHRLQEEHDFITTLIQDPAFPTKVNDIVIEWGNALYQSILDQYVSGENVSIAELRQVWRNTGFSPLSPWDAPVYEQFFVSVRAVNQKLPPSQRLRVLAGDPPVDWTKSKEEIIAVKKQKPRDEHFAAVVEKEVFAKDRKALIIMGGGHLFRHSWNPYSDQQPETVMDILDQHHPKATFVVMVHAFEERSADLESRLASWPKPGFALLKNTAGDYRHRSGFVAKFDPRIS